MDRVKAITFAESNVEPLVPDVPKDEIEVNNLDNSNCPNMHGVDKTNYSTISSVDSNQIISNYATVSSINSHHRDTVLLLYQEHKAFTQSCENRLRRKSRNATICFILMIVIVIILIVISVISFHDKVSHGDQQEISTVLSVGIGNVSSATTVKPAFLFNNTDYNVVVLHNSTIQQ